MVDYAEEGCCEVRKDADHDATAVKAVMPGLPAATRRRRAVHTCEEIPSQGVEECRR